MENENEEVVEDLNEDEQEESSETINYEEKYKEMEGRLKRLQTKLDKKSETKESNKTNKGELDYGQKAFLAANGIKGADELTLVKDFMENTGKSLEEILENKHFLNEVKEIRDTKAVNDAVPGASKRGGGAARDSVEYWIAKGELPPANQPQLRRDYVNAKLKKSKEGNMFYNS